MKTLKLTWLLLGLALVSVVPSVEAAGCSCADVSQTKIDALVGEDLKQCVHDLAEEIKSPQMAGDRGACEGFVSQAVKRQQWLDSLPGGPKKYLLVDHSSFDDYFFGFSVGYEFTSINETFGKGFPRIGLLIHRRYSNWFSMSGQFLLTSSAEQKLQDPNQPQTTQSDATKTLEWEVQPFVAPFNVAANFHGDGDGEKRRLVEKIGFTGVLGGRKTDQMEKVDIRRYLGLRAAFNPYTYFDMLIGKTESLTSRRVELRGQMPVLRLANGSRFYIGGVVNMALQNRDQPDEKDVARIYVKWDSPDFSNLLGLGSTP